MFHPLTMERSAARMTWSGHLATPEWFWARLPDGLGNFRAVGALDQDSIKVLQVCYGEFYIFHLSELTFPSANVSGRAEL